ncbi:PilC/PilY family type IV pilus protein [Neisseria sp. Ec49-e6-T10]|uniref:PilC/PilY family type IV pilus protein n=1 Tax=Neisseria sp. Ec49-e6-T10 TaxID=3140744 RepID=UPI003EBF6D6C
MNIPAFPIKIITFGVFCAIVAGHSPVTLAADLFPNLPLYMQTRQINKTKPNLMMLLDNSASMSATDRQEDGTYRRRDEVAKEVATLVMKQNKEHFRWGLAFMNNQTTKDKEVKGAGVALTYYNNNYSRPNGAITVYIKDTTDAHINDLLENVDKLTPTGGTPLYASLRTIYNYMGGTNGFQGIGDNVMQYRCQQNFVLAITDGESGDGIAQNNVDPENKINVNGYNANIVQFASNYDYKQGGNDLEGVSFDDSFFPVQNIRTSAVGMYANSTSLANLATYGNGFYEAATTASKLAEALTRILGKLQYQPPKYTPNQSGIGGPINSASGNNVVIVTPKLDPDKWSSELEMTLLNSKTLQPITDNQGKAIIKYPISSHETYRTAVLSDSSEEGGLIDLHRYRLSDYTKRDIEMNNKFNLGALGIDISKDTTKWRKDQGYINWLTGWESPCCDANTGFRQRSTVVDSGITNDAMKRHLGEIIDSPIKLTGYTISRTDMSGWGRIDLPKFMVVPSNDGQVRIYTAATMGLGNYYANRPYSEKFAYIPGSAQREGGQTLIQDLVFRAAPGYGSDVPRMAFLNGGMTDRTTVNGHTFVVGALGEGGKAAYALNIGGTNEATGAFVGIDVDRGNSASNTTADQNAHKKWKDTVPLWDTSNEKFGNAYTGTEKIGYTISTPMVDRLALKRDKDQLPLIDDDVRQATFLANGYQSLEEKPTLYVLDTLGINVRRTGSIAATDKPGTVLATLQPDAQVGNAALSTPAPIALHNSDVIDLVYAGDSKGNLYRYDFRGKDSSEWTAKLIYKGDPSQPITTKPSLYVNGHTVVVLFGTGSGIFQQDLESTDIQSVYGIYDDISDLDPTPLTYADRNDNSKFLKQSLSEQEDKTNGEVYLINSNNLRTETQKGWFVDLNSPDGSRVIYDSEIIAGTLTVSTIGYSGLANVGPNSNIKCFGASSSSNSSLLQLRAIDGGTPKRNTAQLGLLSNSNGEIVSGKKYNTLMGRMTLLSSNNNNRSAYGATNNTGVERAYGKQAEEGAKQCENGSVLVISTGEGNEFIEVKCPSSVSRRISWRTIA